MKDSFFRWWKKLSDFVYRFVTRITYCVLSYRRCKGAPPLSREEKSRINQYWKDNYGKRVPLYEYAWYKSQGIDPDPRLIPDVIWHSVIEPAFTNIQMERGFCDKNYFDIVIGSQNSPETVCRCINSQLLSGDYEALDIEMACQILRQEKEVICKPSIDSGGGRSIIFLSGEEITLDKLQSLIKDYAGNFIMQRIVKQHAFMNQFNANSLNTMRITTFLYKGEVHLLYGAVRVGGARSRVDNYSSGGYYIQLTRDGKLSDYALQKNHTTHELIKCTELSNGMHFAQLQVPNWQEIMDLVRKFHYKLPHFQIINWDIALREDGTPIFIEYNLIDSTPFPDQMNVGPVLGDLTDSVLQSISKK